MGAQQFIFFCINISWWSTSRVLVVERERVEVLTNIMITEDCWLSFKFGVEHLCSKHSASIKL